ncbi:MAG TPA: dihydrofolate reductase family protein [Solirubrobacteraceae bacterium]
MNSVSLDGYSAGPDQSEEHPLGIGGLQLHGWHIGDVDPANQPVVDELSDNVGAVIMGRNMFGPVRGEWDREWNGWWGEDPPYHVPVFVLTHYPRASVEMQGGTTFHFVTDGIESALEQARAAAGDQDVLIGGGASTVRQYLRAGLVDRFTLNVAPVVLGGGERPLDGLEPGSFKLERVIDAPEATHLTYSAR